MVHILYVQKGSYNEERSELNWKEIGEKLFSEGEKFPTVGRKFDAAKKIAVKISCGENFEVRGPDHLTGNPPPSILDTPIFLVFSTLT